MSQPTYRLIHVKGTETFNGTLDEAIARAVAIEEEYQPAFGVTVEDASSSQAVAEIRDGVNIDAKEE